MRRPNPKVAIMPSWSDVVSFFSSNKKSDEHKDSKKQSYADEVKNYSDDQLVSLIDKYTKIVGKKSKELAKVLGTAPMGYGNTLSQMAENQILLALKAESRKRVEDRGQSISAGAMSQTR